MNIKDIYKTKKDIDSMSKDFLSKKKYIKSMIENAKQNGEEINRICDLILEELDNNTYNIDFIQSNLYKIKNIVGG